MRKLQTIDLFNALRLIKRADLKEELKPVLAKAANGEFTAQDMGIEAIIDFIGIMTEKKAEYAIYEVLSGPFEMTAEDVGAMDLTLFIDNLEVLAKENNLRTFFQALFGLMSKSL